MAELIERLVVPSRMSRHTNEAVVVLSPWNTTITTVNEYGGFGITVPTSRLGCMKILTSQSRSGFYAISINEQRFNMPIKDNAASSNGMGGKSIPDVTFWFRANVEGTPQEGK